ncbi:MAG: tRNA preQ1(34) S-adenosylmethionine ribosyltransferase-isomerase QueA [Gammaproteobacteria bacterium]
MKNSIDHGDLSDVANDGEQLDIDYFNYHLPQNLIAQFPLKERSQSRLLCLNRKTGARSNRHFAELPQLLSEGDLLVFNDTRVIPARLFGHKQSGGKTELLIERVVDTNRVLAQIRASKAPKTGSRIILTDGTEFEVLGRRDSFFLLQCLSGVPVLDVIETTGHMPLPPYIVRNDEPFDQERYQTIFAKEKGAVAAPTAGLHFDHDIYAQLENQGVATAFITLHVGAATFQPVRVKKIGQHKMHEEFINVSEGVCNQIAETKQQGGRVIAVGTTSVRSLEAASTSGTARPFKGNTDIFICPGYTFHCVDAIITNFHIPQSTLLMLVCAFGGLQNVMNAYKDAVKQQYRFYSYGDAMFLY